MPLSKPTDWGKGEAERYGAGEAPVTPPCEDCDAYKEAKMHDLGTLWLPVEKDRDPE